MKKRFLFLALAVSLNGCVPTLRDQLALEQLSHKATAACVSAVGGAKRPVCVSAKLCATSIKSAVEAVQAAQEARAKGQADSDLDTTAAGLTAGAKATCKAGGF
jgi:hypothetical protein